ncbi:helix-turn-helix domain-containing protein [Stenotrophobium rhamnosiphilum]|uniref:HTH araC/xylS-type domain-containing protein n=1 Tax=Stenotrophobium rhamnosiphilum TaxID=2029166 RepID=A0A2T5MCG8_9GAMM|nr:AraC family transcriptional regulator [Stenotrophobium rhamnosiphilum]PTU30272.1 hypothetical protein CJD38_15090 [Stenotrophobium rhamnosiphilum]
MSEGQSVFPVGLKAYYGRRRFLLLTQTYLMDRVANPYRRLSATLLIACNKPLRLEAGDEAPIETRAVLIAPNVLRRRTIALNSDLVIFDIPVGSPEYTALESTLESRKILPLDFERFAPLESLIKRAAQDTLNSEEVDQLFKSAVLAACGREPVARELDPRIEKAMALIEDLPFNEVTLELLSERLHVSPSRLRHLFKEQTGCNLSHYARWVAVWRATHLWKQGKPLTDIAHEVGFYDLAHLGRAFNEVFGWNPSAVIDPAVITLIRCS